MIPTLDRVFFDREFERMLPVRTSRRLFVPALDVVEKADVYLVSAELPGIDPSDVEISFENDTLTLRGTKHPWLQTPENGEELRIYTAERLSGTFERAVRLPEYVEGDRIEALYENGVLTITIPKAQAARPRKIEIKSAAQATQAQLEGANA
jgi:HSP20 family protein